MTDVNTRVLRLIAYELEVPRDKLELPIELLADVLEACRKLKQRPALDPDQLAKVLCYAAGALSERTIVSGPEQKEDDQAIAKLCWHLAEQL
jgi:hypothetical protein